jgi:peptidyl-prolyl cis-trans isomerase A (cyclophilin A)
MPPHCNQEEESKMKKCLTVILTVGVATGTLWAQATSTSAKAAPQKSATAKAAPAPAPKGSLLEPASLNQKAPEAFKAKFTTTKGDFVVQVTRAWAPLGADRFYNLVESGYFTNVVFFRVVPGFVVQFGINGNPKIAAAWSNAKIQDDPVKQSNKPGTLTFATAGPNTRTTQIFINFGDNSGLDKQGFSPFGEVVDGMDVVNKLYNGYGEQVTNLQDKIEAQGNDFLKVRFPNLDSIKSAVVVPAATSTATKKPATMGRASPPAGAKKALPPAEKQ